MLQLWKKISIPTQEVKKKKEKFVRIERSTWPMKSQQTRSSWTKESQGGCGVLRLESPARKIYTINARGDVRNGQPRRVAVKWQIVNIR